jgi:hypothetical protein
MKTKIIITGQINGNFILKSAIKTWDCEDSRLPFNGFKLVFNTKKEAKKAMWEVFKYLKQNEPDFVSMDDYSAKRGVILYDASRAELHPAN